MTTRRHALAAALLAALPLGAAAQSTVLFNFFIQQSHPVNTRIIKPWTDEITKATEGRVSSTSRPPAWPRRPSNWTAWSRACSTWPTSSTA
jgi:TRAP-type C4-dicarboxylate transport system substrate-binding protein